MKKNPLVGKVWRLESFSCSLEPYHHQLHRRLGNRRSTSSGHWLYVGGRGPGNYTKIQDAINDSSDGDTVFVFDDSAPYFESLIINKSITLLGENQNTTIIDGTGLTTEKMIDVKHQMLL